MVSSTLSVSPPLPVAYAKVDFGAFAKPCHAAASLSKGRLTTRLGASLDYQRAMRGDAGLVHVYGMANGNDAWLDGTRTDVSGTPLVTGDRRRVGELGAGGSDSWRGRLYCVSTEVSAHSALQDFGNRYSLQATAGFRARF